MPIEYLNFSFTVLFQIFRDYINNIHFMITLHRFVLETHVSTWKYQGKYIM